VSLVKSDISSREDIEVLVDTFYKKVLMDELIGHFFTDVVKLDWEKHIPVMYDFWEMALLDKMIYHGNPMLKHIALDKMSKLEESHFDKWILLFSATLDELYAGPKVELAKQKIQTMKSLMLHKIKQSRGGYFIQ